MSGRNTWFAIGHHLNVGSEHFTSASVAIRKQLNVGSDNLSGWATSGMGGRNIFHQRHLQYQDQKQLNGRLEQLTLTIFSMLRSATLNFGTLAMSGLNTGVGNSNEMYVESENFTSAHLTSARCSMSGQNTWIWIGNKLNIGSEHFTWAI